MKKKSSFHEITWFYPSMLDLKGGTYSLHLRDSKEKQLELQIKHSDIGKFLINVVNAVYKLDRNMGMQRLFHTISADVVRLPKEAVGLQFELEENGGLGVELSYEQAVALCDTIKAAIAAGPTDKPEHPQ